MERMERRERMMGYGKNPAFREEMMKRKEEPSLMTRLSEIITHQGYLTLIHSDLVLGITKYRTYVLKSRYGACSESVAINYLERIIAYRADPQIPDAIDIPIVRPVVRKETKEPQEIIKNFSH
jgi:hypothetical protein